MTGSGRQPIVLLGVDHAGQASQALPELLHRPDGSSIVSGHVGNEHDCSLVEIGRGVLQAGLFRPGHGVAPNEMDTERPQPVPARADDLPLRASDIGDDRTASPEVSVGPDEGQGRLGGYADHRKGGFREHLLRDGATGVDHPAPEGFVDGRATPGPPENAHVAPAAQAEPEGGPEWSPNQIAARDYLEAITAPDGLLLSDDPLLAFQAGRLILPALTEASFKQIRLGNLTTADLVDGVLRLRPQAALFSTGRLALLPRLEDWVATMAAERRDFGEMRAYRLDAWPKPEHSVDERLGDAIRLTGYSLSADDLKAGSTLTMTLFWSAQRPVPDDYTVFVHLFGQGGALLAQHDGPPLMATYPTSHWAENVVIPDRHVLTVGTEAPAGQYDLLVGMYRQPSLERLPAYSAGGVRWPGDTVVLGQVGIVPP